ncbi:MAG: helix-turn-helix transcriptional regulator [Planctomycetales bacterium]
MHDNPTPLQLAWNRLILLLHELRLRRGWTIEELARQAGVSRTTLYYLERGDTSRPRMGTLRKLSKALGDELLPLLTDLANLPPDQAPALMSDEEFYDPDADLENIAGERDFKDEFDRQTNPEVRNLTQQEPELFENWTAREWRELYSTMGMGGALNPDGVRAQVLKIRRKRQTVEQLEVILETHLGDVAAGLIESLYRQIQLKPENGAREQGWQPPPRNLPPGVQNK